MLRGGFFRMPGFANSLVLRIGVLMLVSLAVFAFSVYTLIGRPTVDRLAETQMRLAAERLEARVSHLFKSVETTLHSSHGWVGNNDIGEARICPPSISIVRLARCVTSALS